MPDACNITFATCGERCVSDKTTPTCRATPYVPTVVPLVVLYATGRKAEFERAGMLHHLGHVWSYSGS